MCARTARCREWSGHQGVRGAKGVVRYASLRRAAGTVGIRFLARGTLEFGIKDHRCVVGFPFRSSNGGVRLPKGSSCGLRRVLSTVGFAVPCSVTSMSSDSGATSVFPKAPFPLLFRVRIDSYAKGGAGYGDIHFGCGLGAVLRMGLVAYNFRSRSVSAKQFMLSHVGGRGCRFRRVEFSYVRNRRNRLIFRPDSIRCCFRPIAVRRSKADVLGGRLRGDRSNTNRMNFWLSGSNAGRVRCNGDGCCSFRRPRRKDGRVPLFVHPHACKGGISDKRVVDQIGVIIVCGWSVSPALALKKNTSWHTTKLGDTRWSMLRVHYATKY